MFCQNLVFNIWPSSVLPSSGIAKFDFRHVLPKSGLGKTDVLPKSVLPSSGTPFFELFSKGHHRNHFIFELEVVQTFPEAGTRSK